MLTSADEVTRTHAAMAMHAYARGCGALLPAPPDGDWHNPVYAARITAAYTLFVSYSVHHRLDATALLDGIDRICHLPTVIVQGRYDVICPPIIAHRLHTAWPEATYVVVPDAGHSGMDPSLVAALVRATESLK